MHYLSSSLAVLRHICPDILRAFCICLCEDIAGIDSILATEAQEGFAGAALFVKGHLQDQHGAMQNNKCYVP